MVNQVVKLSYSEVRKLPYPKWLEYQEKLAAEGDEPAEERVRTAKRLQHSELIHEIRKRQWG